MFNERHRLNRRIEALETNADAAAEGRVPDHPWGISVRDQIEDVVATTTQQAKALRLWREAGERMPLEADRGIDMAAIRASYADDSEMPADVAVFVEEHVKKLAEGVPDGFPNGEQAIYRLHEDTVRAARRRLYEGS